MRIVYVVTYDITDNKRLRAVFKLMRGYGDHLQYSVFWCELSDREHTELVAKLSEIIKHSEDQVLFFRLGPAGKARSDDVMSVGVPYNPLERGAVVI